MDPDKQYTYGAIIPLLLLAGRSGRGPSPLSGRCVISVSISENTINEIRSLQTIYSPVVVGRGPSPFPGRGVTSVSKSDNIIN